jgi:hypothetical protein
MKKKTLGWEKVTLINWSKIEKILSRKPDEFFGKNWRKKAEPCEKAIWIHEDDFGGLVAPFPEFTLGVKNGVAYIRMEEMFEDGTGKQYYKDTFGKTGERHA